MVDAELSVSSPFGMCLTFFRFTALMMVLAFHLTFLIVLLAFDARDLNDFELDFMEWLSPVFSLVMVDK